MPGPILPGDVVTMRIDVHTRDGVTPYAFPVVVLEGANAAGMLRVRADGDAARRFGAMHWVRAADCERVR